MGKQARSNYRYKARRKANNTITTGYLVTPSTDPGDYIVEPNANLKLEAGDAIILKPGTHIKSGAKAHLLIKYNPCPGIGKPCAPNSLSTHNTPLIHRDQRDLEAKESVSTQAKIDITKCRFCGTNGMILHEEIKELPLQYFKKNANTAETAEERDVGIKIYSNPAQDVAYIKINNKSTFDYFIYDIMGTSIANGVGRDRAEIHLSKGVYIIKLKINESWHTRKLIMY
ncbi:MAG: T9SS type A sorting domain-containing protein [Brumimicrobium sp.]